ncbi:uncharacterized protein LOC116618843 [Nematostella vectensis]|uniref:uncharacterized protein LOC116618843 n=1 Tax=Nematostella vectensis TaxID=45351 RepID=UPI002076F97D|nr:uncharacterized protein LOC116618843 [Nematostella vectensis]
MPNRKPTEPTTSFVTSSRVIFAQECCMTSLLGWLKMADKPDFLKDLISSAIKEVHSKKRSFELSEITDEYFLASLPDDSFYYLKSISGNRENFKAHVLTEDITEENLELWISEYEVINNVSIKLKTKKNPTSGYVLQNYYRCQHNTRNWSPSKDPQKKLHINPSARVKNTNCPFQMIVKLDNKGCCSLDIEWEHNHSLETLEASNFLYLTPECTERVLKMYESGHTPATARQQYLKELKQSCNDDLEFHRKKANRAVVPRRRDFSYLYTQYGKDRYGGQGVMMYQRLAERLEQYSKDNPDATTHHQVYGGEDKPLLVAIVTPLMKRVHNEVQQSGEMVFVDATSNTEEHNLKVFVMCTHNVSGALPLGILIASDERESTLKQGFKMLCSCLPEYAFNGRGKENGPKVILTDNCKEERNALKSIWPLSTLLLCTFHMLQQLWRWLHESKNNVNLADRPFILNLFKKSLYAETEQEFENSFSELLNDDHCMENPTLVSYLQKLYNDKESFALCFRKELPVRGNHTNNFAEAQFLVLKDIILRRTKEYNVVGLLDKLTIDLEDHYKNKLLSIADGSFDGTYRHRFMGKGKGKGSFGFNVPDRKELDGYLSSVESFGNNTFKVGSSSYGSQSHTVDMTIGMCTCGIGKDGSPCKHQYVLWVSKLADCVNFVPVNNPRERQKLAWLAIGETLPLSYYMPLRSTEAEQITLQPCGPNECGTVIEKSINRDQEPNYTTGEEIHDEDKSIIANAQQLMRSSCDQIIQNLQSSGDLNLAKGIIKFSKRVTTLTATRSMNSNLVSALFSFGSNELKKTGSGKKIRVQPNRKRKCGSGSRQAVSKGRPVQLQEPTSKRKRSHDLAKVVQANVNSSKKSGSHTMKSKTKHIQKKKTKKEKS